MTVNALMKQLEEESGLEYTRQHMYKVLGKMVEVGMLTKVGSKFAIDARWASDVHALFGSALTAMAEGQSGVTITEKEGGSKEYIAESFHAFADIWDKVSLELLEKHDRVSHRFCSHPYLHLYAKATDSGYYEYLADKTYSIHTLFGGDTVLDNLGLDLYSKHEGWHAAIQTNMPFAQTGYMLEVTGPYIMECRIPPTIEMHFAFMFQHCTDPERFDKYMYAEIFKIKAPFRLVISKSSDDAEKLRTMISSVF